MSAADILRELDKASASVDSRNLKIRNTVDFPVSVPDISAYPVGQIAEAICSTLKSTAAPHPLRCLELIEPNSKSAMIILDIYSAEHVEIVLGAHPAIPFNEDECRAMLSPLVESISGEIVKISYSHDLKHPSWEITVSLNDMSITPQRAWEFGRESLSMIELSQTRPPYGIGWVLSKLRSGDLDNIVGCTESNYLDFKMLSDVESNSGRIKIAREVAAFANGDRTAVLVIGYKTDKINGVDTAVKLTPVKSRGNEPERYRQIIDDRVVPHIRGLEVDRFDIDNDRSIVWILIPLQPDERKPFLVRGTIVDSKTRGEFFSIDVRRGDGTVSTDAREVHSWLSYGRQQLINQANAHTNVTPPTASER